jgi:hypothetical protein
MKIKISFALLAAVLIASLTAPAALAASGPERTGMLGSDAKNVQTKKLNADMASGPGKTLRIDPGQAHLTISAWDKNQISAEAVIEVGDSDPDFIKEFLDNTKMTIESEAAGLVLRLTSPMDWDRREAGSFRKIGEALRTGRWNLSYAARVEIHVPASQSLDVNDHFGNVAVRGVNGQIGLRNESGEVRVDGCGGDLKIKNSFGAVQVVDFKGPADIRSESGEVQAENIAGKTEIHNSFKDVQFVKIGGPLTVTSESAGVAGSDVGGDCRITSSFKTIDVRGVRGRLEVKGESSDVTIDNVSLDAVIVSSFKPVKVTNVKGGLRVTSESASVRVEDIGGDASIKSSFQSIEASRVHGRLSVDGQSSAVTVRDADKDVDVKSSFKDIIVAGVGGELRIEGESSAVLAENIGGAVNVKSSFKNVILRGTSGSITVVGESSSVEIEAVKALPAGSLIDIKTSFKPIRLTLPAGTEIQGTAKTQFGKINTAIPVILKDSGAFEGQSVRFESGKGGITLTLETSADITINRK